MRRGRFRVGRKELAARLLSALLATLLLFSGPLLAHHAASFAQHSTELALHALPDGSLPVLCLGDGAAGNGETGGKDSCPLCRVASPSLLPTPGGDFEICRFASRHHFHPHAREILVRSPVLVALAPPTGPPLS